MHRRVLLTVAAMGFLVACASTHGHAASPASSAPTSPTVAASSPAKPATLTGTLLAVGGPAGASPRPLAGRVSIAGANTSGPNLTQRLTVGADGTYRLTLAPGTYTVTGTSPQYNDGAATCRTENPTVTLAAGQSVTADVLCAER